MSTSKAIRTSMRRMPKGKPFTSSRFLKHGPRTAVDRALARLVESGEIERLSRGVFVRPRTNRLIGKVMPSISESVMAIAKKNGEIVQVHGAEAARRFKLSTQVPTLPVYYTSGSSRTIQVRNVEVRLIHTSNRRRLQFAGKKTGVALSALWYLGKGNVNSETISMIKSGLTTKEFETLSAANVPAWMTAAFNEFSQIDAHV